MTPENTGEEKLDTPQQDALTRATLVGETRRIAESPCIVDEGAGLRDVAEALSAHRGVHTIAVVNAAGALAGIIPARLLLDELFLQVAPEEFLTDILDQERVEEYGRMVRAHTAGELMQEPAYVRAEDTMGDAFALMRDRELEGLTVVDEHLKPMGYLDRLELVEVWLQMHQSAEGGSTA